MAEGMRVISRRWPSTRFSSLVRCRLPLIQAPMAGGPTTPGLVASVCNAGAVGFIGGAYESPESLRRLIREVKGRVGEGVPFGVGLFIPQPFQLDPHKLQLSLAAMEPAARQLGVPTSNLVIDDVTKARIAFEEQAEVVLEERVPIFSCTFGIPSSTWVQRLKAAGTVVIGTATTVEEAEACVDAGMDAVVAQGGEAGGHRGTFLPTEGETMTSTMTLVPQIVDKVRIPVIAAGGIMDGRGIMGALSLGAEAVQMGTAFLTTHESGASPSYKKFLLSPEGRSRATTITKGFSGRPARGVMNRFIKDMRQVEDQLPDFPIQNVMTRPLRQAATKAHDPEFQSLWAGQAFALTREMSASELVHSLDLEVQDILRSWSHK